MSTLYQGANESRDGMGNSSLLRDSVCRSFHSPKGGRSILMIVSRSGRLLGISKHGGSLSLLSTTELRLTRCKATRWTAVTCDLRPAKGYASTSPNLFGSFLFGTSKLCLTGSGCSSAARCGFEVLSFPAWVCVCSCCILHPTAASCMILFWVLHEPFTQDTLCMDIHRPTV